MDLKKIANSYINVPTVLITDYKLKGNELLIASLILGFTRDENSWFTGPISYVQKMTGTSYSTAHKALTSLVEKGLLIKEDVLIGTTNMKYCKYRFNLDIKNEEDGNMALKGFENVTKKSNYEIALEKYKGNKPIQPYDAAVMYVHEYELLYSKKPSQEENHLLKRFKKLKEEYNDETYNQTYERVFCWLHFWHSSDWSTDDDGKEARFNINSTGWILDKLDNKQPRSNKKQPTYGSNVSFEGRTKRRTK